MPRPRTSMDEQFPLAPLDQHHDLATWHKRSEEALLRHYSDLDHMDRFRRLLGIGPPAPVSVAPQPTVQVSGPGFPGLVPSAPSAPTNPLGPTTVQPKPVQQDLAVPPAQVEGALPAQPLPSMRRR